MNRITGYELTDLETPGKVAEKFDKKVMKLFVKSLNPDVKPEKIFEGYVKPKKPPKHKKKNKK